jgi:DNA-binding winged helix-turn-helix (wHTH) protein
LEERNSRLHDQPIRFLSCELDPARRRLLRDGHEVHVTPKAFDLLKLLVHAAPRVVSKR